MLGLLQQSLPHEAVGLLDTKPKAGVVEIHTWIASLKLQNSCTLLFSKLKNQSAKFTFVDYGLSKSEVDPIAQRHTLIISNRLTTTWLFIRTTFIKAGESAAEVITPLSEKRAS